MANKKYIDKGFSKISHHYEALDKSSSLINWMRMRVREHLEKLLIPKSNILEINCGSGIDAVYLAKKKHNVHATDVASGMIDYVKLKREKERLTDYLTCEVRSFTELEPLKSKKFNLIFSNFGGLNCSSLTELEDVFNSFSKILEPNGKIALVIMPKICIWEFLKIFKGNKNAFRRLKKNGVLANIEGEKVHTYYHSSKQIKKMLSPNFTDFKIENICFLAPTGNRVDFPKNHPRFFNFLIGFDTLTNKIPFLRGYGDYYIISATKIS